MPEQIRTQRVRRRRPPENDPEPEEIVPPREVGETTMRVVNKIDDSIDKDTVARNLS